MISNWRCPSLLTEMIFWVSPKAVAWKFSHTASYPALNLNFTCIGWAEGLSFCALKSNTQRGYSSLKSLNVMYGLPSPPM